MQLNPCLRCHSAQKVVLSDNKIDGGGAGLKPLGSLVALETIDLSNNRIEKISDLEPLAGLPALMVLDLFQNPVTTVENYRQQVFDLCTSLKYLDGMDKDGNEMEDYGEDDEEEEEEEDIDGLVCPVANS